MTPKRSAAKIRVLVVDDSAQMVRLLSTFLETLAGIEVVGTASDGIGALQQAESLSPDLILMDLQMPRLGGLEATRQLRKQFPAIRVIIVTSHDTEEARKASLAAGANAYVAKDRLKRDLTVEISHLFGATGP